MHELPMTLILIEDDVKECKLFEDYVKTRKDVKFIGITDSDIEGIEYAKNNTPEGIILDLELHKGKGSGLNFLMKIKELELSYKPKIVVTTNVFSDSVYNYVHENGADIIFYKKQENYSVETVINTLFILRNVKDNSNISKTIVLEKENETDIISEKINAELNLIGIGPHLQGKKYLYDAIYYLLQKNETTNGTVIQYLVKKYKRSNSTISRAMQNAILHAWRISAIEDLTTHYTARINYQTGVPTPTEFMYYYADKIKKII